MPMFDEDSGFEEPYQKQQSVPDTPANTHGGQDKKFIPKEIDPSTVNPVLRVCVIMDKAITRPDIERVNQALRMYEEAGFIIRVGPADKDNVDQKAVTHGINNIETVGPWKKFESHGKPLNPDYWIGQKALILYGKLVPFFDKVPENVKKIAAVPIGLLLGKYVSDLVNVVINWTPDGCTHVANKTNDTGFTLPMIRLADRYNVPVFNAKNPDFIEQVTRNINQFVKPTH